MSGQAKTRPGQERVGQGRTGQDREGWSRPKKARTGKEVQSRPKKARAGQIPVLNFKVNKSLLYTRYTKVILCLYKYK